MLRLDDIIEYRPTRITDPIDALHPPATGPRAKGDTTAGLVSTRAERGGRAWALRCHRYQTGSQRRWPPSRLPTVDRCSRGRWRTSARVTRLLLLWPVARYHAPPTSLTAIGSPQDVTAARWKPIITFTTLLVLAKTEDLSSRIQGLLFVIPGR